MKKRKFRVVVIGGGTGLSTVLRGLKESEYFDLTAIVTVADDGGSSGLLRKDYDIPPPGDVRNVIAALSEVEPLVEKMFQYRFSQSETLAGHSLGNLMLTALTDITGDFSYAIAEMSKVFNVRGKVLPASNEKVTLYAELEDNSFVVGESNFPFVDSKIRHVYMEPQHAQTLPETVRAISRADVILVGPGSLYTSIIPNLLVPEIRDAVVKASGHKIYISNLMTQKGETVGMTASDHVEALYQHVGEPFLDRILLNDVELPPVIRAVYKEESAEPIKFDIEKLRVLGLAIDQSHVATFKNGTVRHKGYNVRCWLEDFLRIHGSKRKRVLKTL